MNRLLNKNKAIDVCKRTAGTLAIPVIVAAVLLIICAASGRTLISNVSGFTYFLDYAAVITLTTIALSINLNSGRFDFSLGSMAVLSCLISVKITGIMGMDATNGTAIVTLLLCVVVGLFIGTLSGFIYVLLKIPPIITSLGVTLIFEGITYTIAEGKPVSVMTQYNFMHDNWLFAIILLVLVLAVVIYLFDFTKFGYNYKSLKEGQKVSVNIGIKEVPNAIACYAICGAIMGIVGFLNGGISGGLDGRSLSFGSIGLMFSAFLPMFIGGFIGKFSNDKLGYLLAGLTMSLLNSTFSVFTNEVSYSVQSIINAVLLVIFLIYLSNQNLIKDIFTCKHLRNYLKKKKIKTDTE